MSEPDTSQWNGSFFVYVRYHYHTSMYHLLRLVATYHDDNFVFRPLRLMLIFYVNLLLRLLEQSKQIEGDELCAVSSSFVECSFNNTLSFMYYTCFQVLCLSVCCNHTFQHRPIPWISMFPYGYITKPDVERLKTSRRRLGKQLHAC